MQWPNLPENYGNGQRNFDMTKAAYDASEPYIYGTALGVFFGIQYWLPIWAAILGAIASYFLAVAPLKRNLKKARAMWEEDIRAYHEHLESNTNDSIR